MTASIATITWYLFASMGLFKFHHQKKLIFQIIALPCLYFALFAHGWLLYSWIDTQVGQNLSILNLISFCLWLISLFTAILALKKPISQIIILLAPITAVSVLLTITYPSQYMIQAEINSLELLHIFLALFSFSLLTTSGLLAVVYLLQDNYLKTKNTYMVLLLPSLEVLDTLLFQLLWLGFVLLSIGITAGLLSAEIWSVLLLNKLCFTLISWLVYASLLWARYFKYWQGLAAMKAVSAGTVLMLLSYFGSRLIF